MPRPVPPPTARLPESAFGGCSHPEGPLQPASTPASCRRASRSSWGSERGEAPHPSGRERRSAKSPSCTDSSGRGASDSTIAKALAGPGLDQARALLIDLPDHGRSPWSPEGFSYAAYADAVAATLAASAPGESFGRWSAIRSAARPRCLRPLQHSDLIDKLCVVDIAPKSYGNLHRFTGYIEAMKRLPLGS